MTPVTLRRHLKYLPVVAIAAGALIFLPGDENARPTAALPTEDAPSQPSYLARLPAPDESFTTASVAPVQSAAQVESTAVTEPEVTQMASLSAPPALGDGALDAAEVPGFFVRAALGPGEIGQDAIGAEDADGIDDTGATRLAHATTAVNVRSGPSSSNAKLFVLQEGQTVRTLAEDGGWVEVLTGDGGTGWVYSRYLDLGGPGEAVVAHAGEAEQAIAEPERQEPVEVASAAAEEAPEYEGRSARLGDDVALRAGPSRGSPRLFILERGERVKIAETRGDWARIVLRSGVSGWVRIR